MKNYNILIRVLIFIFLVLGLLFIILFKLASDSHKEYQDAVVEYEDITDKNIVVTEEPQVVEEEVSDIPVIEVDFENLKNTNSDFIGWLHFPYLEIDYPIVQETEVNEYIHKTFEGNTNSSGCIFMDLYSDANFNDYHDIIFGHNMKNNTMFGKFKELYHDETIDITENPFVYIYTDDKAIKYKIFAYYKTVFDSDTYKIVNDAYEYDWFVDYIKSQDTLYFDDSVDFSNRDSILTLSTCSGKSGGNTRFVIHCIKTEEITK